MCVCFYKKKKKLSPFMDRFGLNSSISYLYKKKLKFYIKESLDLANFEGTATYKSIVFFKYV